VFPVVALLTAARFVAFEALVVAACSAAELAETEAVLLAFEDWFGLTSWFEF
jgi:hypothetical protein